MEERGIEAGGIDVDGIGPFPLDRRRGDDVVVRVLEVAVIALDVRIDQPEQAIRIGEARRPDAATIGISAPIELAGPLQRKAHQRDRKSTRLNSSHNAASRITTS